VVSRSRGVVSYSPCPGFILVIAGDVYALFPADAAASLEGVCGPGVLAVTAADAAVAAVLPGELAVDAERLDDVAPGFTGLVRVFADGGLEYYVRLPDILHVPPSCIPQQMMPAYIAAIAAFYAETRKRRMKARQCGNSTVYTAPTNTDKDRMYTRITITPITIYYPSTP